MEYNVMAYRKTRVTAIIINPFKNGGYRVTVDRKKAHKVFGFTTMREVIDLVLEETGCDKRGNDG